MFIISILYLKNVTFFSKDVYLKSDICSQILKESLFISDELITKCNEALFSCFTFLETLRVQVYKTYDS